MTILERMNELERRMKALEQRESPKPVSVPPLPAEQRARRLVKELHRRHAARPTRERAVVPHTTETALRAWIAAWRDIPDIAPTDVYHAHKSDARLAAIAYNALVNSDPNAEIAVCYPGHLTSIRRLAMGNGAMDIRGHQWTPFDRIGSIEWPSSEE